MKDHSHTSHQHLAYDSTDQDREFEQELHDRQVERRSRFRRWRLTKLALWLALPALIIWMAPTIIAQLSLHNNILHNAIGPFAGQIEAGGASFGWLSPVRLRDLVIRDAAGDQVVVVPQVESQRTLLGLLTHLSDPGLFRVVEPAVNLKLRSDGSNLEDLLASFPKKESSSGSRPQIAIEIIDGTLVLTDESTGGSWRAGRLLARVDVPASPTAPLEVKLQTRIQTEGRPVQPAAGIGGRELTRIEFPAEPAGMSADAAPPHAPVGRDGESGSVTAEFVWTPPAPTESEAGGALGRGQLKFVSDALPLDFAAAFLRRFVEPRLSLAGTLSLRGEYEWSTDADGERASPAHQLTLESLDARQLDLSAPRWIRQDRIQIPQLGGHGQIALHGSQLQLRDVDFNAGFARLQATGAASLDELRSGFVAGGAAGGSASTGAYELRGDLDLAQLAQLLPDTLRIREGTQITSGTLSVALTSRTERGGRRWEGKLASSNLVAENLGRRVTWEQPLQIQLAAFQDAGGVVVERLDCVSSFLQAEARGTLDDGQLTLRGDLRKLAEELERFVDLGSSELAGQLRGDLNWRRQANDQIEAQGELRLEQLQVALEQTRPWHEDLLVAKLTARAVTNGSSLGRVEAATVNITAGDDSLQATLTEAVVAPGPATVWPVQGRLVGHLENWLPRVQIWLPLAGWTLAGTADVTFAGRCAAQQIQCDEGMLNLINLQVRGPGWNIIEPQVKVELAGQWSRDQNRILSPGLTFTSSALALRAENVSLTHGDEGLRMAALVGFRSDLGRLTSWIQEPGKSASWNVSGMSVGQVKLTQVGASTSAEWSIDVDKLTYSAPTQAHAGPVGTIPGGPSRILPTAGAGPQFRPVWQEPKLRVTGKGNFDGERGELDIERCDVSADDLQIIAKGKVAELAGRCVVDLEGELGYDLETLSARFRQQLGPGLEIRGRDSQPFVLRGPLLNPVMSSATPEPDNRFAVAGQPAAQPHWPPAELTGEAGLHWDSIVAYGLPIGPGEIQGKLSQGAIDFKPLDVKVSEGHVRLAPRLLFEQRGPLLVAQAGPALEDVRISPQMSAQWLKFVLPILADATQVDGRMSLGLDDVAVVPLAAPLEGEARGTIDVRSIQVGPGPLSREIISLAQLVEAIVKKQPPVTDANAQQRAWVEMPGQRIPFHWKDHRVYHQGLQMAVKDVVITTRGSVGIDHSIDLLAEVPVRDEWVASNRYLQALKGQKLQVPITGTLTAPRLDRRALQQLTAQTVTGAARGLLEQEVTRGVDKLLRPRGETPAPGTAPAGTPQPSPPPTLPFIPKLPFPPQ